MTQEARPLITAWSYSRFGMYEECPFKAYLKIHLKRPEPEAPALKRGGDIHKKIEDYLLGKREQVPEEVHPKLREVYADLKDASPQVERELAFDKDWKPVGWFSSAAWCRIKMDVMTWPRNETTYVIDHKTGKVKDKGEYDLQLDLYGVGGFLTAPEVKVVNTELNFTDHGVVIEDSFKRENFDKMRKAWEDRVRPMLSDTTYVPRPGNHCRWCHFRKGNGGECPY